MTHRFTPLASLTPVMGTSGCLGHVRASARGYWAYDANDRLIAVYLDPAAAIKAVLTAQST